MSSVVIPNRYRKKSHPYTTAFLNSYVPSNPKALQARAYGIGSTPLEFKGAVVLAEKPRYLRVEKVLEETGVNIRDLLRSHQPTSAQVQMHLPDNAQLISAIPTPPPGLGHLISQIDRPADDSTADQPQTDTNNKKPQDAAAPAQTAAPDAADSWFTDASEQTAQPAPAKPRLRAPYPVPGALHMLDSQPHIAPAAEFKRRSLLAEPVELF